MVDFLGENGSDSSVFGFSVERTDSVPIQQPEHVSFPAGLPLSWSAMGPILPRRTLARSVQLALKRAIDIVAALVLMAAIGIPLAGVAAAIIATSPGPALFRQTREGMNGKPFVIYKLRTMEKGDGQETTVTALGAFLRRMSLDELPQLFNVLKGDMSLVGPRPHVLDMKIGETSYNECVPYYAMRNSVRPGISGWAQVNGCRGPIDDDCAARARVDHDLAYIQNFSLLLDFKIMALTLLREFLRGSGR